MKAALVDAKNAVSNIVMWADDAVAPAGMKAVTLADDAHVSIGWHMNADGSFTDPNANVPPPVPAQVTDRQFFQAAAMIGIITKDEALAYMATGAIPSALASAVSTLSSDAQFAAKMQIIGAQFFQRDNPLVAMLGAAMGKQPSDIDALFTLAATL